MTIDLDGMKYRNCKPDIFESCLNVCQKAKKKSKDSLKNCVNICVGKAKELCGDKTRMTAKFSRFVTSVETENSSKGWVMISAFLVILAILITVLLI